MANYLANSDDLTAVANAIRAKGGTDAQLTFPAEFVSAIQAIKMGGENGVDITITSTVTNAQEFTDILKTGIGATQCVYAIKTYKNGSPVQNQICSGAIYNNIGATIRYRDSKYSTVNGISSAYDAAVTIGDIYTVYEVSI